MAKKKRSVLNTSINFNSHFFTLFSRTGASSLVLSIAITFIVTNTFAQKKGVMLITDNMYRECSLKTSIQSLNEGTVVLVLKDSCGNKKVRYNGQTGFVLTDVLGPYTSPTKPEPKPIKGPHGPGEFIFDRNKLLKSDK